ncbi:MAG: cysteine desulfurase, partial [Lachnospiraceae bacterium]|nr:cysteine desulfurase [Lachnospiraceae bacterium]
YLKDARAIIAGNLKVQEKEIFFTSGGTESDNLAIIGAARANKRAGMHLITTKIEHPAVLNTMKYLEEEGFSVTYLPVDKDGIVEPEVLKEALTPETILVSVMYVNNEIGSVQPVEELSKVIKAYNPKILFHVDAVQAYGKYRIYPKRQGIDLLAVSGHKIHGPKGVGVLYVSEKAKIKPINYGGGQQKGMRSGTDNVPGIAGIAEAVKEIYTDFDAHIDRLYELKTMFVEGVQKMDNVWVNGRTGRDSAPHVVSVSIPGIRSEVLLHALEDKGIYVSSGSACASNKPAVSETLKAIGLDKTALDSTIRFSFSVFTTKEEIETALAALYELVPMLRRYRRA